MTAVSGPPTVSLAPSAHRSIRRACADAQDGRETGGILLGHEQPNGDLRITTAGGPGPKAIRAVDRFRRDPDHAQALSDQAWTNARSVWIGDWHTHPNGQAQPSPLDFRIYLDLLDDQELQFNAFLAIIVIPAGVPALYPWIINRHHAVLTRLAVPIGHSSANAAAKPSCL